MTTRSTKRNAAVDEGRAALARKVREIEAAFCCGGTLTLETPVELRLRNGRSIPIVRDEGWKQRGIGKKLADLCQPAPFGRGKVTHHDRRVRDGGQLSAANGAFDLRRLDLVESGILHEVHRVLCPGDARPPDAELYALNVYRPGGHFVSHKDTPRDRDVFGTLVVCLPVPFRAGCLVLRHETERRYEWAIDDSYSYRQQDLGYRIQWAAFFGDVDHEVEAVLGGTRVTITWLLRRADSGELPMAVPATSESDLCAALADPKLLPRGGVLGIPCVHLYAEAPGLVLLAETLSRATAGRLKGRDGLIARAALEAGLRVRYRPYLFETCADESWRLTRAPSEHEASIFRDYRLGASELEESMPIERHVDWNSQDDVTWLLPPPWRRGADQHPSLDAVPATQLLGELEYSATDYFGNEGCDTAFYVAAALLLDLPPASRRGAVTRGSTVRNEPKPAKRRRPQPSRTR